MEILNHNLTTLAFNLGLLVTALAIVLLAIITLIHWLADRRLEHSMLFDRFKRPMIMSYLDGHTPEINVIRAIEKEPTEAMRLLLEISRKLQPSAQTRMLTLFADLPGVGKQTRAIDSPLTKRRIKAAERLSLLRGDATDRALLHALDDKVIAVRYSAACSLAEHGKPEHLKPILQAFDAEHEINWFRLVEIAVDYGPSAIPTLIEVLDDPFHYSPNVLNVAIRALGILKESQAVPSLISLLKHHESSVRLNSAHALGDIGDPAATSALAQQGYDVDPRVRLDALEAIGKLHADRQIPVLIESLADPTWWVRYTAAQALHSLGEPGIEQLKEQMHSTHDPYVHDACLDVLSEHKALDLGPCELIPTSAPRDSRSDPPKFIQTNPLGNPKPKRSIEPQPNPPRP